MGNILAHKKGNKQMFTEQDWKTGIPAKDGWAIVEGEISLETPKANVLPNQKKPSIIQPIKNAVSEVIEGAKELLHINKEDETSENANTSADEKKADENDVKLEGQNEALKASKPSPKSSDVTAHEAVLVIESMTDIDEIKKYISGDNRTTVINAFTKKTKISE